VDTTGHLLVFRGQADPPLGPTDDEIDFTLAIRIDNHPDGSPAIALGRPVEVKDNPSVHISANARVFLYQPQDPVSTVTGTITFSSLDYRETSGTALLMFTDPEDVNPAIREWLILELTFTNLATMYGCPNE
jgi:hypothetical protein